MLTIDGSYGEGGGQILRTTLALSMINGMKVKVENIRANRPNPGLSYQHLMAVKASSEICDAETEGVKKGSDQIIFDPGELKGGTYKFDIGTAGSVTLLLQAIIPPALSAQNKVTLKVSGGTDVKWSPPYDYFENVFLELVRSMNGKIDTELIKRGHYPKGGGEIKVDIEPSDLKKLAFQDEGNNISKVEGRAFVTDLPDHIAERMKKEALKEFLEIDTDISISKYNSPSPGTGIVLWTRGNRVLGKGRLGEKGVPAEKVGKKTAEELKEEIVSDVDLDTNAADQIIPFLPICEGSGIFTTRKITDHLKTNIWVTNKFHEDDIELIEKDDRVVIKY